MPTKWSGPPLSFMSAMSHPKNNLFSSTVPHCIAQDSFMWKEKSSIQWIAHADVSDRPDCLSESPSPADHLSWLTTCGWTPVKDGKAFSLCRWRHLSSFTEFCSYLLASAQQSAEQEGIQTRARLLFHWICSSWGLHLSPLGGPMIIAYWENPLNQHVLTLPRPTYMGPYFRWLKYTWALALVERRKLWRLQLLSLLCGRFGCFCKS